MVVYLVRPLFLETSPNLLFFPELNPRQRAKHALPGVFGLFQGKHEPMKRLVQILHRSVRQQQIPLKADKVVRGVGQRALHGAHWWCVCQYTERTPTGGRDLLVLRRPAATS